MEVQRGRCKPPLPCMAHAGGRAAVPGARGCTWFGWRRWVAAPEGSRWGRRQRWEGVSRRETASTRPERRPRSDDEIDDRAADTALASRIMHATCLNPSIAPANARWISRLHLRLVGRPRHPSRPAVANIHTSYTRIRPTPDASRLSASVLGVCSRCGCCRCYCSCSFPRDAVRKRRPSRTSRCNRDCASQHPSYSPTQPLHARNAAQHFAHPPRRDIHARTYIHIHTYLRTSAQPVVDYPCPCPGTSPPRLTPTPIL